MQALANARVLADDGFVSDRVLLLDGERIVALTPKDDPRIAKAERRDLQGAYLMPGFIDCQVNGGGGVLFNDDPSV
ncbi:MAG TPA: N-acetylglucosamine-6-phosphate deacetylase, partial [Casimicrobiaceae bacterium]|nr:N-acetylglucosamine-6-phosphate deacetylase [Casimicrobiaceae bacterium]